MHHSSLEAEPADARHCAWCSVSCEHSIEVHHPTDNVHSIPLCGAVVALIFLHRRLQRRQRAEDLNDPHDSIDFGMQGVQKFGSKRPKGSKNPEMIVTDLGGATHSGKKGGQGLSFDLGVNSPYLLPAGLQGSSESIHSMSRNFHDDHDPYRSGVAAMRPSMDTDSVRFGRLHDDKGSLYSLSTGHHSSSAPLVANARPMSQTLSRIGGESVSSPLATPSSDFPPSRSLHSSISRHSPPYSEKNLPEIVERDVLPSPPAVPDPVLLEMPPPRKSSTNSPVPVPARKDSLSSPSSASRPESSNYGDDEPAAPTNPNVVINEPYDIDPLEMYARYSIDGADAQPVPVMHAPQPQRMSTLGAPSLSIVPGNASSGSRLSVMGGGQRLSVIGAGNRLSVMGARPLPADLPDDNPEVRANRIRSFYKEYFDDSKPVPANAQYEVDDYYDDGIMDGAIYDPDTGGFFIPGTKPFAQPVGRRAMTPPPRSKPRVGSGNSGVPHQRKFSTYSTMSGGRPGMRGRPLAAKKLPPPMPLLSLPTPHALKQDAWISNPIDFAPPSSVRSFQNGARPDSPFGSQRPYSPSVRAFTPLASSFDTLQALPSPHDLRKSTTFTALDFAPPSRIRDPAMGGGSDAGSIRSARSGISAMQHQAVREGAYRVSRIPKEMVTSREDLASQLRPKMDMVSRA